MKYEPRSRKNTICDVVSAGECLVRPNCMPSLISMFFVHALHLQFYPCSVLLCLFSAIHKGIHALINPVSVPQKMMSFAAKMLVILLPADSLPTFCCFSLNHIWMILGLLLQVK